MARQSMLCGNGNHRGSFGNFDRSAVWPCRFLRDASPPSWSSVLTPNENSQDLVGHPGLKVLLPAVASALQKRLTAVSSQNNSTASPEAEGYAARVFDKVVELDNSLGALRLALKFVTELGHEKKPDPDVYRYHYENFVLRVVGFLDRAHRLVGAALQLSVKKVESVHGNTYVQEQVKAEHAEVHAALLAVSQVVESYRKPRNELVHAAAFSSRDLGLFTALKHVKIETAGIDADELARQHYSKGGAEISLAIVDLKAALNTLLDALTPHFGKFHRGNH